MPGGGGPDRAQALSHAAQTRPPASQQHSRHAPRRRSTQGLVHGVWIQCGAPYPGLIACAVNTGCKTYCLGKVRSTFPRLLDFTFLAGVGHTNKRAWVWSILGKYECGAHQEKDECGTH